MPCLVHTSDLVVTERINVAGFISDVTHCSVCGARIVTPKERPWPISAGAWRVTRNKTANPDSQRIVHAENLTKEYAEIVARNWRAFNTKVEAMEEAVS